MSTPAAADDLEARRTAYMDDLTSTMGWQPGSTSRWESPQTSQSTTIIEGNGELHNCESLNFDEPTAASIKDLTEGLIIISGIKLGTIGLLGALFDIDRELFIHHCSRDSSPLDLLHKRRPLDTFPCKRCWHIDSNGHGLFLGVGDPASFSHKLKAFYEAHERHIAEMDQYPSRKNEALAIMNRHSAGTTRLSFYEIRTDLCEFLMNTHTQRCG